MMLKNSMDVMWCMWPLLRRVRLLHGRDVICLHASLRVVEASTIALGAWYRLVDMSSTKLVLGAVVAIATGCGGVEAPAVDAAQSDVPPRDVVCGAAPVEVLPNGGFDDPTPAWTQAPTSPVLLCDMTVIRPDSGTKSACMGGVDGTTLTLSQQIPLPVKASQVTLTGKRCITTQETASADNDTLEFELLDGTTTISAVGKLSNQQGAASCEFSQFTLTQPVSRDPVTATLRIRSTLDSERTTSFFIDSLSLKVSCSP